MHKNDRRTVILVCGLLALTAVLGAGAELLFGPGHDVDRQHALWTALIICLFGGLLCGLVLLVGIDPPSRRRHGHGPSDDPASPWAKGTGGQNSTNQWYTGRRGGGSAA
jgi:hypothetical protein